MPTNLATQLATINPIATATATVHSITVVVPSYDRHQWRRIRREVPDKRNLVPGKVCDEITGYKWWDTLTVHEPSRKVRQVLHAVCEEQSGCLSAFHLAFDFVPRRGRIEGLAVLLKRHLTLWRTANGTPDHTDNALNWIDQQGGAQRDRNGTTYIRFSTITGEQCVRVELKLQNAETCKRDGFNQPNDLDELHPQHIFAKHVRAYEYDPEQERAKFIRKNWHLANAQAAQRRFNGTASTWGEEYDAAIPRYLARTWNVLGLEYVQGMHAYNPRRFAQLKPKPENWLYVSPDLAWHGGRSDHCNHTDISQNTPSSVPAVAKRQKVDVTTLTTTRKTVSKTTRDATPKTPEPTAQSNRREQEDENKFFERDDLSEIFSKNRAPLTHAVRQPKRTVRERSKVKLNRQRV